MQYQYVFLHPTPVPVPGLVLGPTLPTPEASRALLLKLAKTRLLLWGCNCFIPTPLTLVFFGGGRKIVTYNKWGVWEIVSYIFFGPKKLGEGGFKKM
jgi:hypothetical protein